MTTATATQRIGKLRYPHSDRLHSFVCEDLRFRPGEACVVVHKDGRESFAEVRRRPGPLPLDAGCTGCLPKVVRKATAEDCQARAEAESLERHAHAFCREKVAARDLPMKILFVERPFNRNRLIFHFSAEHRVDFRELVKDLAHMYNTRIEMRQDGVRDHAAVMGGLGPCGASLCCATHLDRFDPVGIKMAKQQGISLSPNSITGMCGRLKCCLRYEYDPAKGGKRRTRPAADTDTTPTFHA